MPLPVLAFAVFGLSASDLSLEFESAVNHSLAVSSGPAPSIPCILGKCAIPIAKCAANTDCRSALICTKQCAATNQTCIFQCTSDFENEVYDALIRCFFTKNDCMREPAGQQFSTYEKCRGTNLSTPLQTYRGRPMTTALTRTLLTRNGMFNGSWLVAQGLSHAYDCFDCQKLYFNPSTTNVSRLSYTAIYKIHKSDGSVRWNRAEYSADFDSWPQSARMHLHAPDYGGLVHDEDWRVLAVDERSENDPRWIALYYCGGAPGVKEAYEGSCVMTPDGVLPPDARERAKIEAAYTAVGIKLACVPNNTAAACAGAPPFS